MEQLLRYDQICVEKLPLVKIRKNKPKSEISLSQLLNISTRYIFWWMTNAMQLVKISLRITKYVKIQDGRQLWLKKSGKQQDTQIMEFNHTPTHLVCNIHLIANFLSSHMSWL